MLFPPKYMWKKIHETVNCRVQENKLKRNVIRLYAIDACRLFLHTFFEMKSRFEWKYLRENFFVRSRCYSDVCFCISSRWASFVIGTWIFIKNSAHFQYRNFTIVNFVLCTTQLSHHKFIFIIEQMSRAFLEDDVFIASLYAPQPVFCAPELVFLLFSPFDSFILRYSIGEFARHVTCFRRFTV